jgi:hypothetical protein
MEVETDGPSTLEMDVFTTAFRKVASVTASVGAGGGTLSWDMKDRMGNPVANGLYYLRIRVSGPQTATEIFKVLVLK